MPILEMYGLCPLISIPFLSTLSALIYTFGTYLLHLRIATYTSDFLFAPRTIHLTVSKDSFALTLITMEDPPANRNDHFLSADQLRHFQCTTHLLSLTNSDSHTTIRLVIGEGEVPRLRGSSSTSFLNSQSYLHTRKRYRSSRKSLVSGWKRIVET
jgi:hypothetical protein